jgi:hypothetical protein
MSLISGDMKEEESWRQTQLWLRSLSRHSIGHMWLHHTGHDESHGYGTKTKEWQMDNVIRLEMVERIGTDISFKLMFEKAREREPANRRDFEGVDVALVGNRWTWQCVSGGRQQKLEPLALRFYEVLCDACQETLNGHPAAPIERWREACFGRGLLDRDRENSARSLFSKYKLQLVTRNWVASNETMAWTIGLYLGHEMR